ncbi:MAG: Hpt domain-containing protein [Planctomycetota bacterium]
MSSESLPLRSVYAGDAEFGELIELFVSELPEKVEAIDATLMSRDFRALRTLAHQLKGAGGGYGFPDITDASRTLERLAETADANVQEDLDRLQAAAKDVAALCGRATAD